MISTFRLPLHFRSNPAHDRYQFSPAGRGRAEQPRVIALRRREALAAGCGLGGKRATHVETEAGRGLMCCPPGQGIRRHLAIAFLAVAVMLVGCSINRTARLYPANDKAASTGVLELHFTANGSGHGEGTIQMPEGELLKGEYSLVRGGAIGFGSIFAAATTPSGGAVVNGSNTTMTIPGGSPGTASMFGDRGTSMLCEFYNDNFSGHGYGGCKSSTNAVYRIEY